MSLESINKIVDDKYFQIAFTVSVILFSGCISSYIPKQVGKLLNNIIIKILVIASIFYLSKKNFSLATVLTAAYFLSVRPRQLENMADTYGIQRCNNKQPIGFFNKSCNNQALDTNIKYCKNYPSWLPKIYPKDCSTMPKTSNCKPYLSPWPNQGKVCKNICKDLVTPDQCTASSNCDWIVDPKTKQGSCITDCDWRNGDDDALQSCTNHQFCKYNNNKTKCETKCDSVGITSTICKNSYNCKVDNNKCITDCGVRNSKECSKDDDCKWENNTCINA
jgi:hypothetical protein